MHNKEIQEFVQKFEKYLVQSFAELADDIGFSLIIRNSAKRDPWLVSAEDCGWRGFCGETTDADWLKNILEILNLQKSDLIETVSTKIEEIIKQEDVLYFCVEGGIKDSEIEEKLCDGRKDIIWLVTGKQKGEDIRFLLENVIEKTREELNDWIYVSHLENIEGDLFQAVRNKEKIRGCYIERICNNAGILDRELISLISAKKYEKRDIYSRIYFGEVPEESMELSFDGNDSVMWKFCKDNLRFIRKMLEMTKEKRTLVVSKSDTGQVMKGIALMNPQEGKQVIFGGYLKWTLLNQGKEILRYEEGNYHLQSERRTERLKKLEDLCLENEKNIKDVIGCLMEQPHGTAAVFLDGSALENELKRLDENKRICKIKPISIINAGEEEKQKVKELLIGISAIDGALIADYQGNIHAIGAILDGEGVIKADLSRGARYNSLKNYINWLVKDKKYERNQIFAIIVSEDGGIDVEVAEAI